MSLDVCLANAVEAGEISKDSARIALEEFEARKAEYLRGGHLNEAQAAEQALADLKAVTARGAKANRHAALNQMRVAKEAMLDMQNASRPDLMIEAALEPMARSGYKGKSVRTLSQAYFRHTAALMSDTLERHRTTVLGNVREVVSFRNMIREAHGFNTGDAVAKASAEAYNTSKEFLRKAFNSFGGDIAYLENHGIAHTHDRIKLLKAGKARWSKDVFDVSDWTKIPNHKTGKMFTTEGGKPNKAAAMTFLGDIFDGITTRGWDTHEPSFAVGGRALYRQRAEPRTLHFSGDGWLKYNDLYGTTDPFTAMLSGLQGMANDVAQLEVLGPSPRAGLEFRIQAAEKRVAAITLEDGAKGAELAEKTRKAAIRARAQFAHVTGEASIPVSLGMARFFSAQRAWNVSSQLGRAVLSAGSDLITASAGALVAGMNPARTSGTFLKLLSMKTTRQEALAMGHILDALLEAGGGASRWWGENIYRGLPNRLAHIQMRTTGLSFWTDMIRTAIRMEHSASLARNAHLALEDLPGQLQKSIRMRGITADDWDLLRDPAHHYVTKAGARFITPFYWLESKAAPDDPFRPQAQALAMRLAAGVEDEVEAGVPTASLRGRTMLTGGRPGTISGEIMKSAATYKSYTLSLMFKQFDQLSRLDGFKPKTALLIGVSAGLTIMGALRIQLGELSKWNDPRPMNSQEFWGAAMLQGGGLGILGDFLSSSTSRAGRGPIGTLMGPGLGMVADVVQTFGTEGSNLINGKPTHMSRGLIDLMRRYTPIFSSHWAIATAWDRGVADTLLGWLDPKALRDRQKSQKRRAKEFHTRSWWEPGQILPSRLPNLMNAFGEDK